MLPSVLQNVAALTDGFISTAYADDVQGWGSDAPIFRELIEQVRPRVIIEVGTWKGASALHMARCCDELGLETKIICVDTWLGAYEFIGAGEERDLMRVYGWPHIYYQFLANVIKAGQQERIYPFPQTSLIAGRFLLHHAVKADLIYIDGSHDPMDVLADVRQYRGLLRQGGVLFGDDYDAWPDLRAAIHDYLREVEVVDGRYWVQR